MDKGTIVYIGGFELPDKNAAAHRVISNSKILNNLGYKIVFIGVNKDLPKSNLFSPKKGNFNNYELWEFSYPKTKSQWIRYLVESKSKIEILDSYSNIKAVVLYNYQSIPFSKILKYCK
ncbi:MAG: glycosyltransferase family 4 protein, partial [Clostridiaceae bacterium]|nr:glycosyltransferase family 4 protein [Clostridiaceae bacterium]